MEHGGRSASAAALPCRPQAADLATNLAADLVAFGRPGGRP